MTGFLARVVARATGREDSLAPRPEYRFAAAPSIFHDPPWPRTALTSLPPVPADAGDTQPDRAFSVEMLSPQNDVDAPPRSPPAHTSMRLQEATPPAPQYADEDADPAPGMPDRPHPPRDARNGPSGPWDVGDDADARLVPLAPASTRDAAQPAAELAPPGDAPRLPPSVDHRPPAAPALARAERIHRDATPAAQEPPTILVHIGRIDVRAVQSPATAPPTLLKSRLQRPTLEAYLRNRERGRP
jgi:hypothetical protein